MGINMHQAAGKGPPPALESHFLGGGKKNQTPKRKANVAGIALFTQALHRSQQSPEDDEVSWPLWWSSTAAGVQKGG